jgi:hypothetical protein
MDTAEISLSNKIDLLLNDHITKTPSASDDSSLGSKNYPFRDLSGRIFFPDEVNPALIKILVPTSSGVYQLSEMQKSDEVIPAIMPTMDDLVAVYRKFLTAHDIDGSASDPGGTRARRTFTV